MYRSLSVTCDHRCVVQKVVKSAADMAGYLDVGRAARKTAATAMNATSSRSHGVLTVVVERRTVVDDQESIRVGACCICAC
jgi:Kinesin motor domain